MSRGTAREPGFASLSSGLLARKGQARPAMRPQIFTSVRDAEEDLGWDDRGAPRHPGIRLPADLAEGQEGTDAPVVVPPPAVIGQQRALARAFEAPARASRPAARRIAFTLRLDADRHLRLRVAAALVGTSSQRLLVDALDRWLATHPDVERLVESLPDAPAED